VDATCRLRIGSKNNEYLLVEPTRWEFPDCEEYWDANWFYASVTIAAGGFRGSFEALLRAEEFVRFRDELRPLQQSLNGQAKFETMEHWLAIDVEGDGRGHFAARCEARDQPGVGNTLSFTLSFDQTELPAILRDLDEIARRFSVRGVPPGA
jgi:hypothetical protein